MRLQDEYEVVLKCVLIMELIWVAKYGKWEKSHLFGQFLKGGTGTEQSGTGTTLVLSTSTGTGTHALFWTSVSILAITWSFLIRFECFKLMVKLDFKVNKTP